MLCLQEDEEAEEVEKQFLEENDLADIRAGRIDMFFLMLVNKIN